MKISVLGWYNHDNIGDEAFKIVFPRLMPDHRVRCVEGLKNDDDSDCYILGGGDVVYDSYMQYLRKFPDKRKIAVSVTLTPNSSLDELNLFEHIHVRDEMSLALGQQYVDSSKISYMPDITFALQPDPVAGRNWLAEAYSSAGLELYEKVVVCVVSSYVASNRRDALSRDFINFLNLADILSESADTHQASFVFLPFSTMPPNDDRMSNSFVAGRSKFYSKNYVVHQKLSVQATLNILSCAQAVVSTRLHSTIFSTLSGIPFIDLTHHDKNLGFIQTLGKPDWSLPLWQFGGSDFNGLLGSFIDGRVPDQELVDFTTKSRAQLESLVLYK